MNYLVRGRPLFFITTLLFFIIYFFLTPRPFTRALIFSGLKLIKKQDLLRSYAFNMEIKAKGNLYRMLGIKERVHAPLIVVCDDIGNLYVGTFDRRGIFKEDWEIIPGKAIGPPVLSYHPIEKKVYISLLGLDKAIWLGSFDKGGKFDNNWQRIPIESESPPAMVWDSYQNTMILIVRGKGDDIRLARFKNLKNIMNTWITLPGKTIETPSVISVGDLNRIYLIVKGKENTLWFSSFETEVRFDGKWTPIQLGGLRMDVPGVCWDKVNQRLLVVGRNFDSEIWACRLKEDGSFHSNWEKCSGKSYVSPALSFDNTLEKIMVIGVDERGNIWKSFFEETLSDNWVQIFGRTRSKPAVCF